MMTPREGLERTRNLLMEQGWCKYGLHDEEGRRCLIGAVLDADAVESIRYLNQALGADLSVAARTENKKSPVAAFNDEADTTFNDVIDLLDRAIILAKEDEAA